MAHLEGYVSHIRFHNEENGYTVMEIGNDPRGRSPRGKFSLYQ